MQHDVVAQIQVDITQAVRLKMHLAFVKLVEDAEEEEGRKAGEVMVCQHVRGVLAVDVAHRVPADVVRLVVVEDADKAV